MNEWNKLGCGLSFSLLGGVEKISAVFGDRGGKWVYLRWIGRKKKGQGRSVKRV